MTKKKVCWKITTKCNQECGYCFGFKNIPDLSYNDNKKVLENLINSGINHITWTGGEAVLYPQVDELMKLSKEKGLHNKLVTNGIYLSNNDNKCVDSILDTLDEINLSIDSIEDSINIALGKKNNHFEMIKKLLEKIKDKSINVGINTVVSKMNIDKLEELGEFLNNYKIKKWKFLKFMPIREKSLENEEKFEINETELEKKIKELKTFENIEKIEYKKQSEFEKSIVVLPNADIIITTDCKDHYLGNILKQEQINFDNLKTKIKTLIAIKDKKIIGEVVKTLGTLECVDIIGTAEDSIEAYSKIMNLKPEMVFAEYDIMKPSKEKLNNDIPIFNMIINSNIEEKQVDSLYDEIGDKLNSLITEPIAENIVNVINEYKQIKNI